MPRLWLMALSLAITLAVAAALAMWHLRRVSFDARAQELGSLSLAVSDDIDRGLQGAQGGLYALRRELAEGLLPLPAANATQVLRTRVELMSVVAQVWVVDDLGHVLGASHDQAIPELASFFPALDSLAADQTAVSRPFEDPHTHATQVALAIRFKSGPGFSGGWLVAGMPAGSLQGAFQVASPAPDVKMAVFRSDGVLLSGSIVKTSTLDEASLARRLAQPRSIDVRHFSDGTERLVSLNTLPQYGLKIVLTRDLQFVLSDWRETAQLTALGLVLVYAILAAAVRFVHVADRRRARAQQALVAQLSRTSKLESMGTLAGGVAHDFNNILAAVVGFGEMAQDAAPQGSAQARHLDKVMQAALRGKALVERILAFSRGGARTSEVFEFEPVIEEVLSLLAVSLKPGVVMERRLEATDARLRGDPTQAFEAVMNLCTNAMQAMPDGGMVSVLLKRVQVSVSRVLSHSQLVPGNYLALSVSDQGGGITPEVMDHLFEPFFTTRAATAGTGLGLAVVHGVVAEFGGAIDVQSTAGRGACFTLYLPQCADMLCTSEAMKPASPGGAGQKLLVVDDDPALVALAQDMLTGLGYQPVGFSDPVAALAAFSVEPNLFSAVITDEVMPGLTGTQLTEMLRVDAPDIPVLLVSGYGGALLAKRAVASGVTRVLSKPLQREDLAQVLSELLR